MNNVSLVGRPTKDPELRYTTGGAAVCTFTLAVDRDFKNREGKREADFIYVKVWNRPAENIADYVRKGRLISVTGRIVTDCIQGKDGSRKYFSAVVAENIGFLGAKKNDGEADVGVQDAEAMENTGGTPESDGFTDAPGDAGNPWANNTDKQ